MNGKIDIPGYGAFDAATLASELDKVATALQAVNDAEELLTAISSARHSERQTTNRNAVRLHQTMELAQCGLDDACRDLAAKCRQLFAIIQK